MSGGGAETTSNTIAQPWEGAVPLLENLVGGVQGSYQGGLFDVPSWGGMRVAPQSTMTQSAQDMFYNTATGANPFMGAAGGYYPSLFGQMPQSGLSQMGQNLLGGAVGGDQYLGQAGDVWGGFFNQAGDNQLGGMNAAQGMLGMFGDPSGQATGGLGPMNSMLGLYGDPQSTFGGMDMANRMVGEFADRDVYRDFDQLKSNVLADVVPAVSSRFANSGMLDSSLAADTVSRSASEAIAPIEYGSWENAQQRKLAALGQASGLEANQWNQAANRGLSAYQTAAPLAANQFNQGMNRALSAFQTAAPLERSAYENEQQRALSALGFAPQLQGMSFAPGLTAMNAGQMTDQFNLAQRDDALSALGMAPSLSQARYTDPQMLGFAGNQFDQYNQSLLDAAMGQWYEEANRPYEALQRAIGLGGTLGGMGGQKEVTQGESQGTLGQIGGAISTFLPLAMWAFAMSDRRLKTGIVRIGETAEGYPKYRFRFLWDDPDMVRVGVMADEVPEEITAVGRGGYRMVDYARVTL